MRSALVEPLCNIHGVSDKVPGARQEAMGSLELSLMTHKRTQPVQHPNFQMAVDFAGALPAPLVPSASVRRA